MAEAREVQEWIGEKQVLFHRVVWCLVGLIAAVFVLMMWVVGEPDTYHEHLSEQPPGATSPDGSVIAPAKPDQPAG